ncbi:GNAT family N-acetyltransferase [Leeia oryzae]|uniref:GNAT family N-acetyltransferase n=1 Tax=Leeia oryzae TaxID=356662 RepID=UPI000363580B|nr:GNAT family N-acetyltransferase [Leeia oryzae]
MHVVNVTSLSAPLQQGLAALLMDSVMHGASIGFLWPLTQADAEAYWGSVGQALDKDQLLWVIEEQGEYLGTVQLARCQKQNGRHRAEVQKLMVHSQARGRGLASRLMQQLEVHALTVGISLLVLDTLAGSDAEQFYQQRGWHRAGQIPDYAAAPDGALHPTVYFYKHI